jgi:hypothetical protein
LAVDSLLGGNDALLEEFTLWREVKSVVEDLGVAEGDELVTQSTNLAVEDKTLKINVGAAEAGKTWSLVASARFETDCNFVRILSKQFDLGVRLTESILNNINTPNTVPAGNSVDLWKKTESENFPFMG